MWRQEKLGRFAICKEEAECETLHETIRLPLLEGTDKKRSGLSLLLP